MTPTSRFRLTASRLGRRSLDPAFLYRQTASMLRSGLPLPQALAFLGDELGKSPAAILARARARVEAGEPLSRGLEELPARWVPPADRAAIAAGEAHGRLVEVLESLAADRERFAETESRIAAAATYPLTVLALAGLVTMIVLWKVVPTFAALFASARTIVPSLSAELPVSTRFLLWTGDHLLLYAALVAACVAAWKLGGRERLLPRLPFAREVVSSSLELRFARLLSLLLSAGVPFDAALARCAAAVGDREAQGALEEAATRARSGEPPSAVLKATGLLSPGFLYLLAGSEQRGDFLEVTRAMAEAAEERLSAALDLAQRVFEPASVLLLGAVIGLIVVGAYSPMFELVGLVGY